MMTDDDAKALGLRAVACPGWRWLQGMIFGPIGTLMVVSNSAHGRKLMVTNTSSSAFPPFEMSAERIAGTGYFTEVGPQWPDFRDAATLGCLLALVREAWGCPDADVSRQGRWAGAPGPWVAWCGGTGTATGDTEAGALVAALEAAPRREAAP